MQGDTIVLCHSDCTLGEADIGDHESLMSRYCLTGLLKLQYLTLIYLHFTPPLSIGNVQVCGYIISSFPAEIYLMFMLRRLRYLLTRDNL